LWLTSQRLGLARIAYVGLLWAMRVPVVIELNERPWPCRSDRRPIERHWSPLRGVAGAVSISAYLGKWAAQEARRLNEPLEIMQVPILVDLEESSVRPFPDGPPTVVFAGAPQYDETIRFIFEAMAQVWQGFPDSRLIVTGSGPADPAAQWLLKKAKVGGLDARIDVVGYLLREELLELYSRANALLIPLFDDVRSRARFPTKIGEYLASARPIVTTDVGEVPRFFADRHTAFISAPGDVSAYAAKIAEALADAELSRSVGEAGRQVAAEHFHFARYRNDLLAGFERVAGRVSGVAHDG
jgi:glycosyltransferase involved in cell wall biosynthesis